MGINLLQGSVWKTVLRFSFPFLLSYFLQTLYGMADLYIIGQFCAVESTTAVAIGSQVMHMLTVIIVGFAMGAVVCIGQAVGAGQNKKVANAIGNTVTLFLLFAALATALLLLLVKPIVARMSTPEAAVFGTTAYLQICFLGIPWITAYNVISSVFRGLGDSKTPMYFVAVACLFNIGLDYLFIGYFEMGTRGAALGTVLSQAISVLISLPFVYRKTKCFSLVKSCFLPQKTTLKSIVRIGLPVALQDGFIQIAFLLVTIFANLRGLEDAAAVGIVEKMIGFLFLVPSAMLQTVSTMSAQNIGAKQYARVEKILRCSCFLCIGWGLLAVLLMHTSSALLIGLFTQNTKTIALGCQYMRSYVWDCVFAGIHFCFSGYFCAYGLSSLSFMHNAISILLVRLPLSYLAAKYCLSSLLPMGLASTAGSVLSVGICLCAYIYLKKKKKPLKAISA